MPEKEATKRHLTNEWINDKGAGGGGCPRAHTHNGMLINPVKKIQTHYPHG